MSNDVECLAHCRRTRTSGVILGFTITAAGVVLLLENFNLIHLSRWWQLWPVGLVGIGLAKLTNDRGFAGRIWGATMALAGVALLLANLGYLPVAPAVIWPVLLIVAGVVMLACHLDRRRRVCRNCA